MIDFLYIFNYTPERITKAIERLRCSIDSIKRQNVNIIISNNSKECIYNDIKDLCKIEYSHKHHNVMYNKPLMINYGVKHFVNSEYFLLSDIDLVYPYDYVDNMMIHTKGKSKPVRVIPFNHNMGSSQYLSDVNKLKLLSHNEGGGYAHGNGLIHLDTFISLRGYNESMIGYGPEDTEFNIRIERLNELIFERNVETYHLKHSAFCREYKDKNHVILNKVRNILKSNKNLPLDELITNKGEWGEI